MKLKKILAAVAAAAVAVSTMAVSAFAENVLDSEFVVDTSWSKVAVIGADKFPNAAEGDTVAVTFTIDAADYNLVKLGKGTDWNGLECSSKAVNDADPGFKNQDDGNAVVTVDGTNVYTFTAADAEMAKANGIIVGGYSVTIKSVEYTPVTAAEPAAEETTESTEAAPVAYNVNTVMVMQDSDTWANQKSAEVAITGEGEFTYTLSDLSIDPTKLNVLYIKDANCIDETASGYQSEIADIAVEYKSLKINGSDVAIKDGVQTAIKDGIFDFALYNTWADSFIDLPTDTITSVELTVVISAAAAPAPAVEETTAPVETEAEAEDEDVDVDADEPEEEAEEPEEEVAPVETEAPVAEEAPAPETNTAPAQTGNVAVASIVAVMAVAGAATIVAKKRK